MAALALCLFVIAVGGVLWSLGSDRPRPSALWLCGWIFLLVSGLCLQLGPASAWAPSFLHFTSPLLPACLLAGALAYTDRAVPAWLLPGAALFGGLRTGLELSGRPEVAHGLALGVEPTAELVAALLVLRTRPTTRAGLWLAASFLGVAALDATSAIGGLRGLPLVSPLQWVWAVTAPLALGIQIAAGGQRTLERERRHQLERRRMEEALRVSEGRFQALTENAFDLIAETDAEGIITYTNRRFQEVLARAPREAIDRRIHHFVHPEDHARMLRWERQLTESGAAPPVLARWRRGDGSWRWLESAGKAFRSPGGERRIVASLRDVTRRTEMEEALRRAHDDLEHRVEERTSQLVEANRTLALEVAARRRAEEKLRTSEERYRTISEISSDLSFAYRTEADGGAVREWITEAFTRITGYTPEEFDRRGLTELAHPDDVEAIRSHISAALCGEVRKFEARIVTKWGEARWLRARLAGLRSPVDGHFRLVGALQDVTEARQAEEERRGLEERVRQMQRLESLGVLAGGIAHDFNNLLSVIQGNCALALADLGADSPVRKRLARIQAAARHAAGLTDQMLTYSGRASVTLKPLDLSRLIDDLHELLEAAVAGAGGSLQAELAQPLPLVQGDDTQLRQVVVNLVTNASEALDEGGGTIAIATGSVRLTRDELADAFASPDLPEGEYVYLEVSDTGRGMDPATRERIFEPFFTTKAPGRGMGLAAVLGIVQGHRGALKLVSEPGRGTTFRVLLPQSGAPARVMPARPPARAERLPARVLVVDDEELVLEVAREFLERAGFAVSTARGGEECLRLLGEPGAEIDAVVLDLWMPGLDGEETLARLCRMRPDVPVILASGYRDDSADRRFDRHGVAGFLRKPYEPEELTEKIHAALDLARTA